MNSFNLQQTKLWLKNSHNPLAVIILKQLQALRTLELPLPKFTLTLLYSTYVFFRNFLSTLTRIFCWTPLLKGRLKSVGSHLYLYGGLPFISGPIVIKIGNKCRISGCTTFSGRSCAQQPPTLNVGNNVDIGWMTTIAVGRHIEIGNNVRIAGGNLLAGYPGHPLDAKARAAGLPETDEQVGDIILEDDVWLATGVSIIAGVRIGKGTIVAAGSVVTHDLPARVLAGGIPAKVIRHLSDDNNTRNEKSNA